MLNIVKFEHILELEHILETNLWWKLVVGSSTDHSNMANDCVIYIRDII